MINGAWGGRDGKDGIEGVTNPSQNMSNMPVEMLEARYPLRVEEYALRAGLRRRRAVARRPRAGAAVPPARRARRCCSCAPTGTEHRALRAVRRRPGGAARATSSTAATGWEALPGKVTMEIGRGTVIRHEQAGGGGWGDPAERDPAAVRADIADGKVTGERAEADYGVGAGSGIGSAGFTGELARPRKRMEIVWVRSAHAHPAEAGPRDAGVTAYA